jgi:hypothetical protein
MEKRATRFAHSQVSHFNCAVCRARNSTNEVSYVSTEKPSNWRQGEAAEIEQAKISIKVINEYKFNLILHIIGRVYNWRKGEGADISVKVINKYHLIYIIDTRVSMVGQQKLSILFT